MTPEDGAPLTRRAAREARRAAEQAADGGRAPNGTHQGDTDQAAQNGSAHGARRAGWQPPLRDEERFGEAHGDATGTPPVPEPVRDAQPQPQPQPQPTAPAPSPSPSRRPSPTRRSLRRPWSGGGRHDDVVEDLVEALPADAAPAAPAGRTGGLAQAGAEDFSLAQAVGGVRGAAETLVPGVLFVLTYTLLRDLTIALAVSVGAALLAIVLRVLTRSAPSQALSGAVGVAICAGFALVSGEARNFYLPGFLLNVGYGLLCLVSTLPFRRFRVLGTQRHVGPGPYPVIGLLLGPLTGEGLAWRRVPARLAVYQRVTWLWAGFFLLRLLVQVPLYLADMVGALGAARLAMGPPAFALMVWVSWLLLRAVPRAVPDHEATADADDRGAQSAG